MKSISRFLPAFLILALFAAALAIVGVRPAEAQTLTTLHRFAKLPDGKRPTASLIRDDAGNLYGTTYRGGTANYGTVFKIDASGRETVLYSFEGPGEGDGWKPAASLLRDVHGNLYGTTTFGGVSCGYFADGCGVVFKLDPSGHETVFPFFPDVGQGANPAAGLIRDAQGNLYGTTSAGGDDRCAAPTGCGTVFRIAP